MSILVEAFIKAIKKFPYCGSNIAQLDSKKGYEEGKNNLV